MVYLTASIAALLAGPVIYRASSRFGQLSRAVDGFVVTSITTLLALFVVPHTIEAGGGWAIVWFLVGLAFPLVVERLRENLSGTAHLAALALGVGALLLHAVTDGVALAGSARHQDWTAISFAIIIHRLPVGLALWWLVRPGYGQSRALFVIGLVAVATAAGYQAGGQVEMYFDSVAFAWGLAFVAGSLMHVVFHRHEPHGQPAVVARGRRIEAVGGIAGIVAVVIAPLVGVSHDHGPDLHQYGQRFVQLCLESAPALVLGYGLAGLLFEFMPAASVNWMGRGRSIQQAGRGMLFGLPMPVCSCGVVPLYEGLIKRGVPASAAMAFLVATPELGIEAFLLSFPLLGTELTLIRLVCAAVLALAVGTVVGRTIRQFPNTDNAPSGEVVDRKVGLRVATGLRHGFVDVVDDTAVWIVFGLAVAAAMSPSTLAPLVQGLPAGFDVALFAVVGIPFYVCASGATPLAAALLYGGVSPGAAIAFLLSGPATNVTTFGLLARLHGRRVAIQFGAVMIVLSMAIGWSVNWVAGGLRSPLPVEHSMAHAGAFEIALLTLLAGAFLAAYLRQGPRAFLHTIITLGEDEHSHDHDEPGSGGNCCSHETTQTAVAPA